MRRFENRVVLITGGSAGIGLATARRVAEEGARVLLVARDMDKLTSSLQDLPGGPHMARSCELREDGNIGSLLKEVSGEVGKFYAGILCAGAHSVRPLSMSKPKDFLDMYERNVVSALNTARAFSRVCDPEGASLVLVSSAAAIQGGAGVGAYAAAKGALISLTHAMAMELLPKRIRVNVVVPGVVDTPMSQRFLGSLPKHQAEAVRDAHPLGIGRPEDVAAANAFLASEDARWITGTALVLDGGFTCK